MGTLKDKEELEQEQPNLDDHNDKVTDLFVNLEWLASNTTKAEDEVHTVQHVICKSLTCLKWGLQKVNVEIKPMAFGPDREHYLL